jgi:hypothetical protein
MGTCFVVACTETSTEGYRTAPTTCGGAMPDSDVVGCNLKCPQWPLRPETCDGIDNNCNGCKDEGLTAPSNFCSSLGVCAVGVTPTCTTLPSGGTGWLCDYRGVPFVDADPTTGELLPSESKCDGKDNNCNGITDTDGFPLVTATPTGCNDSKKGACQGKGVYTCDIPNNTVKCNITQPGLSPSQEVCDGKDNDCNGVVDDSNGTGLAHLVDDMKQVTRADTTTFYIYTHEAARPDSTAGQDGVSGARACSKPTPTLPWRNLTWTEANAACQAAGKRLCTAAEWQRSCEGAAQRTYPYGNVYMPNECNGRDFNSDCGTGGQALASGGAFGSAGASCVKPPQTLCVTPEGVTDLSGNVDEWVDKLTPADTTAPFRGGAYDTIQEGMTCQDNFGAAPLGFKFDNLGFRCCSDVAP